MATNYRRGYIGLLIAFRCGGKLLLGAEQHFILYVPGLRGARFLFV